MERKILNPIWEDGDKRERIRVTFEYTMEDGTVQTQQAAISPDSEDWAACLEVRSEEEMDEIWSKHLADRADRQAKQEEGRKRTEERIKQEQLFAKKLEIFEIEEVKASKNRKLKARVRKAASETEALIFAGIIVQEALNAEEAK